MNGYTLTLTAFLLIGGSLGDRFGTRKVYLTGIVWFTLARRQEEPLPQDSAGGTGDDYQVAGQD